MTEIVLSKVCNYMNLDLKQSNALWIGGRLSLYPDHIHVEANALNMKLQPYLQPINLAWSDVQNLQLVKHWFGMDCIEILHVNGTLKIRCYGAKRVIETMRQQKSAIKKNK